MALGVSNKPERCPVCGTQLSGWLEGNCPTCLMQLGVTDAAGARWRALYWDPDVLAKKSETLLAAGNRAEAELLARACLYFLEKEIPYDWRTFAARSVLGGCLIEQKKYSEAEALLVWAYEGMKQRRPRTPTTGATHLRETVQRLVQLYEVTNQPARAAGWKQKIADLGSP